MRLRRLRASMVLKDLSVYRVAEGTQLPYSVVSRILNGRESRPVQEERIAEFVKAQPTPR